MTSLTPTRQPTERPHPDASGPHGRKPVALLVFLENVGHIAGMQLPAWLMGLIDYVTEEYAKLLLRLLGAYRRYDRVVILEDAQATGAHLTHTLVELSRTHRVDLLLLVHGQPRCLVGYRGKEMVDGAVFQSLREGQQAKPGLVDLRMVYGVNCYGATLAPTWLALGAEAANGAAGVNWLPEPSLSLFLWKWLRGASYAEAVVFSAQWARRLGKLLWPDRGAAEDPHIAGSRQAIFGRRDLRLDEQR